MQQLIQYVEQLVPRGMDFILSLAHWNHCLFCWIKAYKKTIENCAAFDGKKRNGPGCYFLFSLGI